MGPGRNWAGSHSPVDRVVYALTRLRRRGSHAFSGCADPPQVRRQPDLQPPWCPTPVRSRSARRWPRPTASSSTPSVTSWPRTSTPSQTRSSRADPPALPPRGFCCGQPRFELSPDGRLTRRCHARPRRVRVALGTHDALGPGPAPMQSTRVPVSGQVRPGRAPSSQPSDPCPRCLGLPVLTRQDTTGPDILGPFWVTSDPIDVRHPGTSKPPTAFPLAGGPSSVSTQSAPEGIRTPNLLIRSNSIDPTPTEASRPQTKRGQMFAQVTGVRTGQGGPGRDVTEPRSRGILGHILGHPGRLG